ncbi:hypothetical protein NQ036_06925 [Brevibacterium sp. 91QC2O2]|uniref:hypothetical protein n=1 Tax=Brevibacterium sp. 91QC2O2 TaxID=2968458 RepID=UPI00211C9576|nr:hypothetical protein [Brevibacterium sp. 91QC2O2]MCQ9367977.1 hypothetical protein [Brevibacterium sp. 91QC2O2]
MPSRTKPAPPTTLGPPPLKPEDLATRWGTTTEELRRLRYQGRGPAFWKLNRAQVRYNLADVIAYEQDTHTQSDRYAS